MAVDYIGFVYAALVATGGIIGYAKKGSVPSLVAGVGFGTLAAGGAYMTTQNPRNVWLLLGSSGVLAGVMGKRFYSSGKFMPAGLMFTLSILMVGRLGYRMLNAPHQD